MCTVCSTELKTKELSVEELGDRWSYLYWEVGAEKLKITEGLNSYVVRGLCMELEDDFAVCSDFDDLLISNFSKLMYFLRKSLIAIYLIPIGHGNFQERLEFRNSIILIEKAE